MDFNIEKKDHKNKDKYSKDELDVAYAFSKEIKKELKDLLKAIVLFGSTARRLQSDISIKSHDIDILLILDDVHIDFSPELVQTYRIITEKLIAKTSKKLHVTSLKLTNFWEYVRSGDPIAINMLRDGIPIIDSGFFEPLQILLYQGRIRPSAEAIQNYLSLAPQTLQRSKSHILQATLDLYWAVIDSAHAVLMSINEIPPSPAHVSDLIDERLVKKGLMDKKYVHIIRQFYALGKSIMHGELLEISGDQYDMYYREARDFVFAMKKFVEKR